MTTATFYLSTEFREITCKIEADVYEGCPPSRGRYGEPLDQGDEPSISYHNVFVDGKDVSFSEAAKLFGISEETFIGICEEEVWQKYEEQPICRELPF